MHRRSLERPIKSKKQTTEEKGTNIQVVLRCRGPSIPEKAANSPIILEPTGTRKRDVLLKTSNKVYSFDRVFSEQSTQEDIYQEVAQPILEEVLRGYNCTIFAYGQTGTGKTYTMEGDLNDYGGSCSIKAGIIPRVVYKLFDTLDAQGTEYSVRVSLIELYNEELRDLLNPSDDGRNLRLYEQINGTGVQVNGIEESFISTASEGLQILQNGSKNRIIAATKCNDKSSRSHSILTLTVRIKETLPGGDEILRVGKLNLVDLAGSENIGRSGAEYARAREAGMINQSLLTLGRVINQLVEHSSHVSYRESKLTRLLKDSLGGRTKTCIIATVSMTHVNHEEIVSTLDYASRAKNIQNRPQANENMSPKLLLREYETTIERLKADLQASRERTGIYLPQHRYDLMVDESEKRRLEVENLTKQAEEYRESLEKVVSELQHKTMSLLGKETELHSILNSLGRIDRELKERISEFISQESQTRKLETSIELLNSLHDNTFAMEGFLKKSVNIQREFSVKIDYIRNTLQEDIRIRNTNTTKQVNSFFDDHEHKLDAIIKLVANIDLNYFEEHINSERVYVKDRAELEQSLQTQWQSFHSDIISKTATFQKELELQTKAFQNKLLDGFNGFTMTMDAGFKMSHLADRIRLKDIGNTEIKLIQSQKNTQKLRENLTALQTAGQTGHGSITKELPSLVSSVTTATSALEDVAIALQGVTSLSPKIKIESDPLDTPQTSSPAITVLSANLSNSSRSTTSSRQGSPSTSYRHSASGIGRYNRVKSSSGSVNPPVLLRKRKSEDADLQNFKRSFRH